MRCSTSRKFISLLLDDQLGESDRLAVSEHIGDCPDCRSHQEILIRGGEALRSRMEEPSEGFEWKVQLGIQKALRERALAEVSEPRGWQFWRPAFLSAGAVAAVVIVAGSLWLGSGQIPSGESAVGSAASRLAQVELPDAPDLSGGVRGDMPLSIDATGGGFGIRTVADQTLWGNPQYEQPVYPFGRTSPSFGPGAVELIRQHHRIQRSLSRTPNGGVSLKFQLYGTTLPPSTQLPDSITTAPTSRR